MNHKKDKKPVSYVKAHTAEMMKKVNLNHRPVFLSQNGEEKAVLIDPESYEKLIRAAALMKIIN